MNKPSFELNKKPIDPEQFLKSELQWGISLENYQFLQLASSVMDEVKKLDVKTILDYGAGVGAYTSKAIEYGYDVYSYEIWNEHKKYMIERIPKLKLIDKPITTDLLMFIETAEHMTDKEIDSLMKSISPKYILFSSTSETTEFDIEWGHINLKPQNEWINLFSKYNYKLEKELTTPTTWTKLFSAI